MAFEAASSSSLPKRYDVFISFRGEDTRSNFTGHLYKALCDKQIRTFIDDQELPKGDDISPSLLHAIEDSYISVVVISENYAFSKWCLDELVHILHCKKNQGQIVVPVFYKVDPSHVRKQSGLFEQAFERYEADPKVAQHKIQMWKQALHEVANVAGYDSLTFRYEYEMIQKIVEDIVHQLNNKYPPAELNGLIGIDDNSQKIEELLIEARTIGIWGMGGIGKSTVAKTIFSRCSSYYESSCFLENVREESENGGLDRLRHKFLSLLLKENIYSFTSTKFLEYRLSRTKAFVVLDDVSTVEQLEYLVGEPFCFGLGSKVLITTRDKNVLSKGVDVIYKVKKLGPYHSHKLFTLNAFNTNQSILGYNDLIESVVVYAKGIPLALKVLGSYLRGRSEVEWESALRKLQKSPHPKIQKVLRLSYDGLDDEEKKIFLDIACFLKGGLKEFIIYFLEKCGFEGAAIGIERLLDKALINVNDGMNVEMHDLIQEMGLQVVREESIDEPEKRSRLFDSQEIYEFFVSNMGSRKVQGIKLNVSQIRYLELEAKTFKKIPNLRYLIFYSANGSSHVHLPNGLDFLPNKMRYLEWYGFPLKSMPSTFFPEKLVKLSMPNSSLKKLWNGVQDFVSLQEINLSDSKQLRELPNLSKCLYLKVVNLMNCKRLREVHPSILSLDSLVVLHLYRCTKLMSLKSEVHLKSLRFIDVNGCNNLKEFSISSDELRSLDLSLSGTKIVDKCVGRSRKLEFLSIGSGFRYVEFSDEFSCLKGLRDLRLYGCEMIDDRKLHVLFGGMLSLTEVFLYDCCNITELPSNMKHLSLLKSLIIRDCERLQCIPQLPPSIKRLFVSDCGSLEIVPTWRISSGGTKEFSFENCVRLNEQSLHNIMEVACSTLYYVRHENMYHYHMDPWLIKFPRSKVPEWFKYKAVGSSIIVELPHIPDLIDVFYCLVFDFHPDVVSKIFLECTYYWEGFELGKSQKQARVYLNSDLVIIWNKASGFGGKQQLLSNMKLRFEFNIRTEWFKDIMVKECGVHPMYVSEGQKFIQKMEMERKKKRPHDVEEQNSLLEFKKFKPDEMDIL